MKNKTNFKNIFGTGLILMLLVVSIIPVVLAEDTTSDTTATVDREISTMDTELGSGLRLLQLERAITRQIMRGQEVVKVIEVSGLYTDDNEYILQAKEIIGDLQTLIDELDTITTVPAPDPKNKENAQKFIAIKNDAKQLSVEFKKVSVLMLKGAGAKETELIAQIKEALQVVDRTEIKEINQQILSIRREYNADRTNAILARIGSADPALIEKIKSGEISPGQIRQEIAKRITSIPPEERRASIQKIREDNAKRAVFKEDTVREHKIAKFQRRSNITERKSVRLQTISDIAEGKGNLRRSENLQNRSDANENWSRNLEKRSDRLLNNTRR